MPVESGILAKAVVRYFNRFQQGLELELTVITVIINVEQLMFIKNLVCDRHALGKYLI